VETLIGLKAASGHLSYELEAVLDTARLYRERLRIPFVIHCFEQVIFISRITVTGGSSIDLIHEHLLRIKIGKNEKSVSKASHGANLF
jgi:hypothetical protein